MNGVIKRTRLSHGALRGMWQDVNEFLKVGMWCNLTNNCVINLVASNMLVSGLAVKDLSACARKPIRVTSKEMTYCLVRLI